MGFILVNLKINFFVSFSSFKYDSDSGAFNVLDLVIRVNSSFFSTIFKGFRINLRFRWCYGNASKWKRFNTEMPQKKQKPLKNRFFWDVSAVSARKTEIPQNPVFEGFPLYFKAFPKIFEGFPLFTWQLFLRNFPILLRDFPIFLRHFRKIFEAILFFEKSFKTLFCWGVSSFFWGVFIFLRRFCF